MKLHLIRHGETASNAEGRVQGHLDVPLSDRGVREADLLAERLAGMNIAALYASPLKRARSTADAVSACLALELQERDFLMERDVGELSGLTGEEIGEKFPAWRKRRYLVNAAEVVPGYERDEVFHERVIPNMLGLVEDHAEQDIVVVTHGGVIGAFSRHVLGITIRRSIEISNASITTYRFPENTDGGQLISLNDTCHLNGHLTPKPGRPRPE
jgi:broad specificity phosphatase PhoE